MSFFLINRTTNSNKMNMNAKPLSCFFLKNQCYMKLDVYDPTVFVNCLALISNSMILMKIVLDRNSFAI